MPPKVASKVLPPKQNNKVEQKPLGIKPPTKAQIQAAKQNVKPGGTVIKAADIQSLLKKDIAPEFRDEAPVDLTKIAAPRDIQAAAAPALQPGPGGVTSYGLPDPSPPTVAQNIPRTVPEPQGIQWGGNQPNYQPPTAQNYALPPAQDVRKKKPSEMTKAEYAEYEKQRERQNWTRLINIVVWRTPSTFEKNEAEDLCRKEPEFAALFNSEMARKQLTAPEKAREDAGARQEEPLLPERRQGDRGSFKPTYDISATNRAAQYERPAPAPQAHQIPQILPDITQQFEQSNQVFQSQQNLILQLQQQVQQLQHQQLSNQLGQNNMQIVPITNSANQHLLQSVQDLQVELQLTQAQASKYQQEVYQLTQEKRQLEQMLQTEQGYRAAAEQRAASMQLDLEALKVQIADLRDKLERATTAELEARAAGVQGGRGGFQLPGGVQPQPHHFGGTNPFAQVSAPGFVAPQKRPQSGPPVPGVPAVESRDSRREDPDFSTMVSNDIDQIMKNANLILDKYQGFDQTFETPAGQQVRQVYQNLMHGHVALAPAPGSAATSDQNSRLFQGDTPGKNPYSQVEQLYQAGGPPGKTPKHQEDEKDVDKTIEDLLQDNETHMMSTQDIQAAPTEIPMSLLNQIPDEDEQPIVYTENQEPEEVQYQQEVGDYNAEHVGSLLPHSKFNAGGQNIRK